MGVPRSWPKERLIGSRFRRLGQAVFMCSGALGVDEAEPVASGSVAERRLGQRPGFGIEIVDEVAIAFVVEQVKEGAEALFAARPAVVFDDHALDVGEPAGLLNFLEDGEFLAFDVELEKVHRLGEVLGEAHVLKCRWAAGGGTADGTSPRFLPGGAFGTRPRGEDRAQAVCTAG